MKNIPVKFKELIEIMRELDQVINLFMITKKLTFLDKVIETINKSLNLKVTEKNLQEILFFVPSLYLVSWVKS